MLAAALLLATAPAAASAAPPWSAPVTVGPAASFVGTPSVSVAPSGTASLQWFSSGRRERDPSVLRSAAVGPDGRVVAGRSLHGAVLVPAVELRGGRSLVVRGPVSSRDRNGFERLDLSASVRLPSGRETARRTLGRSVIVDSLRAAVSATGEPVLEWVEFQPGRRSGAASRRRLRLAVGGHGGRLGAPRTLLDLGPDDATEGTATTALAFTAPDRIVIAVGRGSYDRRGTHRTVEALSGPLRGPFVRSVLGAHDGLVDIDVSASPSGRVAVVWGTQDAGEEANLPYVVRTAVRERGAARFRPAQTIDRGAEVARVDGTPSVAVDAAGTAVVLWSNVRSSKQGDSSPVFVATAPSGSAFGAPRQLSENGSPDAGAIAFGADGRAVVTWASLVDGSDVLEPGAPLAAVRAAEDAPFGVPEEVAPTSERASSPTAAFDPRTNLPVLAWSSQSKEEGPSVPRFARRSDGG
jgi:hypothetical protein